jgi:hypothetical protein
MRIRGRRPIGTFAAGHLSLTLQGVLVSRFVGRGDGAPVRTYLQTVPFPTGAFDYSASGGTRVVVPTVTAPAAATH